jgi:nicotinamide phosphoribosyltransferase
LNPLTQIDFYKADHRNQYPDGTSLVFSNLTARSSRVPGVNDVVFFGLSYYIEKYLKEEWDMNFFLQPKDKVVGQYERRMTNAGINITYEHIESLHDLGYLPLTIMALPEGVSVPVGVPMLVMWNTQPEFFWLTNYLETAISQTLWGPCTSATIAKEYRRMLISAAEATGGAVEFVDWQGHDFSMRGMMGYEASVLSGMGHLLSFTGTDTVAAIDALERYYDANSDEELIGGSVPATEHSVMCMGSQESELETYRNLITKTYPSGIVSIVSDTWDYWGVWTRILPELKDDILARDGTVTIRPDSGDPVKIICGDPDAPEGSPEHKGSFELAWELFGGVTNDKGFRQLDSHINLIYGDSITLERMGHILDGLIAKKFVPSMVFGIGSFTYQYNTRDTFGFAIKATYGEVNGEPRDIFKDPKTDAAVGGSKKSAKGLLAVYQHPGPAEFAPVLVQQASWNDVMSCEFETRFFEGRHLNPPHLRDIRARVQAT